MDAVAQYQPIKFDEVSDTLVYVLSVNSEGAWMIEKFTDTTVTIAGMNNNMSYKLNRDAAWTDRASLVYQDYDVVF